MILRGIPSAAAPRARGVVFLSMFGRVTNASAKRSPLDLTRGGIIAVGDASTRLLGSSANSLLGEAATAAATSRPVVTARLLQLRRPLYVHSGGEDRKPIDNGRTNKCEAPLDVQVTHVHASPGKGAREIAADDTIDAKKSATLDENRIQPGDKVESNQEPLTVRFLDVPGSEETRAEKMTIVFTCTVCETRTAKTFAKLSYNKGVVVARCPGCHNLHLIADRLGWFEEAGDASDGWDIQKITNRIGEAECHVVNEDNVMELTLMDIAGKSSKPSAAAGGAGGEGERQK